MIFPNKGGFFATGFISGGEVRESTQEFESKVTAQKKKPIQKSFHENCYFNLK